MSHQLVARIKELLSDAEDLSAAVSILADKVNLSDSPKRKAVSQLEAALDSIRSTETCLDHACRILTGDV